MAFLNESLLLQASRDTARSDGGDVESRSNGKINDHPPVKGQSRPEQRAPERALKTRTSLPNGDANQRGNIWSTAPGGSPRTPEPCNRPVKKDTGIGLLKKV